MYEHALGAFEKKLFKKISDLSSRLMYSWFYIPLLSAAVGSSSSSSSSLVSNSLSLDLFWDRDILHWIDFLNIDVADWS